MEDMLHGENAAYLKSYENKNVAHDTEAIYFFIIDKFKTQLFIYLCMRPNAELYPHYYHVSSCPHHFVLNMQHIDDNYAV